MAYRQPGVKVTQEFVNALPALAAFALPNVVVAPAFQVVRQRDAGSYAGVAADYAYPDQIAGTIVDLRDTAEDLAHLPVAVDFENTVIRIINQTGTGEADIADDTQFNDATVGIFADVAAGDVIVVTGSGAGNNGSYTVRERLSNNALRTNEAFPNPETGLNYSIRRNLQSTVGVVNIPMDTAGVSKDETQVSLPIALTYDDEVFGVVPIVSADVLLTYRALRLELSADVREYTRVTELQADFGTDQVVPENTLAYGLFIALSNSATPTNALALPADLLDTGAGPGSGDEAVAYQKAFDILAMTEMYAISVLTPLTSVHTALKAHVETLSQPENKLERIGIFNRKIVLVAAVTEEAITSISDGITGPSGGPFTTFTDANAEFITDGVVPGHFLQVLDPIGVIGRYKIAAVVSQTELTLVATGAPPTSANTVTYFIEKDLTKNEQANVMKAFAQGIGSRRMVMTWPDEVKIPVGSSVRTLSGFFLNACVGALVTGLPTQQGFTNLSVAAFSGVVHSTKYFTNDQLNIIAEGGVMIFVQDVLDQTPLYIRHQLTTDASAIKFQELSVTKNVDFIAKFVRDNHKQFIGEYNIVDAALDDLKSNAQGIITFLRDTTRLPKIGGVIRSGKLLSIAQDPVNIDTVVERWQLDIPIPLNNLEITLVV